MPRVRRKGKGRQTDLTWEQHLELELGGPEGAGAFTSPHPRLRSEFASPFTRRAAWYQHRERLLAHHRAGYRPWGWWRFEAPEQPREDEAEVECLDRLGLLSDEERTLVIAEESLLPEGMQHLTRRRQ